MPDLPSGSWEGSLITQDHIDYLRRTRRLPAEDLVEARVPEGEASPQPRDGERMVFGAHFIIGFGLPVSAFFRNFLAFYGLQMHHLGVNFVLYISCFAALCDGY
ncbi:retrotransposon ty3-gypsy subclass [Hordeum vulgare]|nr:retrotransposon ty3-gypsy subclass [Hordeum vulgare]